MSIKNNNENLENFEFRAGIEKNRACLAFSKPIIALRMTGADAIATGEELIRLGSHLVELEKDQEVAK